MKTCQSWLSNVIALLPSRLNPPLPIDPLRPGRLGTVWAQSQTSCVAMNGTAVQEAAAEDAAAAKMTEAATGAAIGSSVVGPTDTSTLNGINVAADTTSDEDGETAQAAQQASEGAPGSSMAATKLPSKKKEALSQVPCKFFRANGCSAGDACPFAHILPGEGQE